MELQITVRFFEIWDSSASDGNKENKNCKLIYPKVDNYLIINIVCASIMIVLSTFSCYAYGKRSSI